MTTIGRICLATSTACVILLPLLADAPASFQTPASGAVTGEVRFTGTVPESKSILVSDGSTISHHDLIVDKKNKGLRDVLALLEDGPAQPKVQGLKPVLVDQVDWVFKPRVVAVQHGQAVRFENSHGVNHSVTAVATNQDNEFNVFVTTPIERTFEPQKAPIMLGCSLHAWMRGWVFVVRHPWFAVSDERGQFRIERVPPGKYTLLLVHPDTKLQERRRIEVEAGKSTELTVEWRQVK
jgi:plastocyanin